MPISPAKLRALLDKMGGTYVHLSKDIGYGGSAINTALWSKKVSRPMMRALDLRYGITYEQIKPDPEKEPEQLRIAELEQTQAVGQSAAADPEQIYIATKRAIIDALHEASEITTNYDVKINTDAIYECTLKAVTEAISAAFKENAKSLRGLIYAATMYAIRNGLRKDLLEEDQGGRNDGTD